MGVNTANKNKRTGKAIVLDHWLSHINLKSNTNVRKNLTMKTALLLTRGLNLKLACLEWNLMN